MVFKISEKDWKIIKLLKMNGRMSDAEIARRLKISKTAVRWRRQKLQEKGILEIVAIVKFDKAKIPYAFVLLKLKPEVNKKDVLKFINTLLNEERVYEICEVAGTYDLKVGIFGSTLDEIFDVVNSLFRGNPIVQTMDILMGVKYWKAFEKPV